MPYEYKNPMLAGFYGHQQAQAEMGATEAEIAGRAAEARYRDSQVEDARLKRLLDMENAPYERKKLYREDVEGDAKLEQAQRDYLVQNVGPLLARVKRGEMPEMEFRAHAQNVVGQAASLFGADEEDVREMLSWSPKEWGLAYEQSMAYKDQVKAPPAVQDIISGDRKQQKQWNPETRRMEVVGEEGVSMEDMVVYLQSELYDFCYLQQNAFDPEDTYCPMERQIELFGLIQSIFDRSFEFDSHDVARAFFLALQNEIKNMNFTPLHSQSYRELWARIEEKIHGHSQGVRQ